MNKLTIGTNDLGDVGIDLEHLIGTHTVVAANSGGGKSGAIRRILEETHGKVQHIVLDAEDEFYTLRERYDYVIAGGDGGDAPATVGNAAGLARSALEFGFSLITQINDLGDDAGAFIEAFIGALLTAPRDHWRPLLVVIDEAQRFAPSNAGSEATRAIKDLLQRGRKRGLSGLLATTRISELHPGVRGLAQNWLIGFVGQTLDRDTAAKQLGFKPSSEEAKGLQLLPPRQFWAFGPAISRHPILFKVGDVETTIVKHGQTRVPTPPPPAALKAILAGLAERPSDTGISDLGASEPSDAATKQQIAKLRAQADEAYERGKVAGVTIGLQRARAAIDDLRVPEISASPAPPPLSPPIQPSKPIQKAAAAPSGAVELNGIAQTILRNLRDISPTRLTWAQAAQMAGRSPKSGPYFAAKKQLVASGTVDTDDVEVWAHGNDRGSGITSAAAIARWQQVTNGFAPRMLEVLADGKGRSRDELGAAMKVSTKSGPWFGGLKQLRERGLIEESGQHLKLVTPVPGSAA